MLASAVRLGDYVYAAPRVCFTHTIDIGNFCVIAANTVVRKPLELFSVVDDVPAKVISRITSDNLIWINTIFPIL